jgi:hypothetical protein
LYVGALQLLGKLLASRVVVDDPRALQECAVKQPAVGGRGSGRNTASGGRIAVVLGSVAVNTRLLRGNSLKLCTTLAAAVALLFASSSAMIARMASGVRAASDALRAPDDDMPSCRVPLCASRSSLPQSVSEQLLRSTVR